MFSRRFLRVVPLCCAAVIACRQSEEKSYVPPSVRAPAPYPSVENAAPLNNAEGYREQARNTKALDEEMTPALTVRLRPLAERNVQGEAKLEEVADNVRMSLRVWDARAGTWRAHLHESTCDDIAAAASGPKAHADFAQRSALSLGTLKVGQDGEGELTASVPRAHLRPDQPGTMLGKSLVVHGSREADRGAVVVACGTVHSD
jgi:Cu/Zn superoxide dismutase